MEDKLAELKRRLLEISDLSGAGAVLGWDQATYMPKGGAAARARQGATLSRLAHERLVDPALGKLLDDLAPYAERLPYDSDEASLVRVVRRDFDKAITRAGRVRRPLERLRLQHPTMPGRAPGRPTTSRPCVRCSSRRSTSAGNTPISSGPTSTSPTR